MLSGRRAEVDQVLAQIIAMLPADTAARLDVAAGLQAYIAQDAVGAERAAQRQREDAEAVRAVALEEENSRLRTELRKVEAIRETLQSISSISVFDEGGVSGGAGGSGAGAANGYHRLLSAAAVRGGSPDVMGLMSASPIPVIPSSVCTNTTISSWADEVTSARTSGTNSTWHSMSVIFISHLR